MNFTKSEIRGAILRAADTFQQNPHLYDFWNTAVPPCGTAGCVVGIIGLELGCSHDNSGFQAAYRALGYQDGLSFYRAFGTETRQEIYSKANPADLAIGLRKFADLHFPANREQLQPAYLKFRASLTNELTAS